MFIFSTKLNNIFEASVYILKMCLHDYTMTSYNAPALAAAAFFYSIRDLAN
jgi:cyclin B